LTLCMSVPKSQKHHIDAMFVVEEKRCGVMSFCLKAFSDRLSLHRPAGKLSMMWAHRKQNSWCCHHDKPLRELTPFIRHMQTQPRCSPRSKPTDLCYESTGRLLPSISTIAAYSYYSVRKTDTHFTRVCVCLSGQ